MNFMLLKELQRQLIDAQQYTYNALVEKSEARRAKDITQARQEAQSTEWDRLLGQGRYDKGAYALRDAMAEQTYRQALDAEVKAEKNYMDALQVSFREIQREDEALYAEELLRERLSCSR